MHNAPSHASYASFPFKIFAIIRIFSQAKSQRCNHNVIKEYDDRPPFPSLFRMATLQQFDSTSNLTTQIKHFYSQGMGALV